MWGDVPLVHQNGIITSYTIRYQSLTQNHNGDKTVDFTKHQTELIDLKKFVTYSITVFASTKIGPGTASKPISVITDEDSKCFFFLFDSAFLVCLLLEITVELI